VEETTHTLPSFVQQVNVKPPHVQVPPTSRAEEPIAFLYSKRSVKGPSLPTVTHVLIPSRKPYRSAMQASLWTSDWTI